VATALLIDATAPGALKGLKDFAGRGFKLIPDVTTALQEKRMT